MEPRRLVVPLPDPGVAADVARPGEVLFQRSQVVLDGEGLAVVSRAVDRVRFGGTVGGAGSVDARGASVPENRVVRPEGGDVHHRFAPGFSREVEVVLPPEAFEVAVVPGRRRRGCHTRRIGGVFQGTPEGPRHHDADLFLLGPRPVLPKERPEGIGGWGGGMDGPQVVSVHVFGDRERHVIPVL